jgi:hypothetical protein
MRVAVPPGMSRPPRAWVRWILAAVVAQGCGSSTTESEPSPTTGDVSSSDPSAPAGSTCARDTDCARGQKCSETRTCIASFQCNTDADCSDARLPFCLADLHSCQPCRGHEGCPAEKPVCTAAWEGGLTCAECTVGHSSICAAGSWCSDDHWPPTQACTPADCQNDRHGAGCTACINEHAQLCYGATGACSGVLSELEACIGAAAEDAGGPACPVDRIATVHICAPTQCQDRAQAVSACLYDCQAAVAACTAS